MNDNEVGELWRVAKNELKSNCPSWWAAEVISLIRELVREREKEFLGAYDGSAERHRKATENVLRNFGIDSFSWNEQ